MTYRMSLLRNSIALMEVINCINMEYKLPGRRPDIRPRGDARPGRPVLDQRGIAVLDVNYGGSTGYGREYRERLDGRSGASSTWTTASTARGTWSAAATWTRSAWRSAAAAPAGTRRCAALTFRDVFRRAPAYYGVGDLEALARDTHKFESRYLDRLVGPYPERRDLYRERSPIHHVDDLSCP